ncbi:unnamed protein product [Ectocarpus sp. CCAP 1310/34]|nr:unnamed protein product [Ectocarpus sp. CCAP 1310/34]
MEKFSKWADRSSGVNPFVPFPPRSPKSLCLLVPVYLLRLCLALVRMPVALSLLMTASVGGALSRYLPVLMAFWAAERAMNGFSSDQVWSTRFLLAIPLLVFAQFGASVFRVFLVRIPLRLALSVMGIKLEEKHADLRRLGLRSPAAEPPSGRPGGGIYRGDIIVRNSCCFLEVLYLQSRVTPQFTAIAAGGGSAPVNLTRIRFVSAVLGSFRGPPAAGTLKKEQTLRDIVTTPRGRTRSIVVAPEAARTNGAGILQLSRVFDSLAHPPSGDTSGYVAQPAVHLVTFSYNRGGSGDGGRRGGFSPAQPVGSALRQLFWLCSQLSRTTMEVSWVAAADVPRFPMRATSRVSSDPSRKFPGPSQLQTPAAWTEEIRSLMAAMIGRPKLALGSKDFASFVEYYDLVSRGDKAGAAALADSRSKN